VRACDHAGLPDCDTIRERIEALLKRNRNMDHELLHATSVGGRERNERGVLHAVLVCFSSFMSIVCCLFGRIREMYHGSK
jgi:hypothetical protein